MTVEVEREKPVKSEMTDEEKKATLQKSANAILMKAVPIHISIAHQNILHKLLCKLHILKSKRTYMLQPLYSGAVIRISKILLEIETLEKLDDIVVQGIDSVAKCGDKMIEIIAIAIENKEQEPSFLLKRFIRKNLTMLEMQTLLNIVVSKMGLIQFLQSIILVKGLSQMESMTKNKMTNVPQNSETSGQQSEVQ